MKILVVATLAFIALTCAPFSITHAQVRGSIIEDRAARKLLEAGDARLDANEQEKAVEIWKSALERYPRSKMRFQAHIRLGDFFLEKQNNFDAARAHFESASGDDNTDLEQRAAATLKLGRCFYESRHYGKCFQIMRDVIETYPTSPEVNQAYYYIGMGHFKQGHYSRAIEALEKVGTALTGEDDTLEKVEAGKRLFVKIEDADLAILGPEDTVDVKCVAASGDEETIACVPVGRNVRVVLGSIPTRLGKAIPNNGILEVKGGDRVKTTYVDKHTADQKFNINRLKDVLVVGEAVVQIMDGAFQDTLQGVVLGKEANLQITDADFDTTDKADKLSAVVEVWRAKTESELDAEIAAKIASGDIAPPGEGEQDAASLVDKWKKIDQVPVSLVEADLRPPPEEDATDTPEPSSGNADVDDFLDEVEGEAAAIDTSIHSGVFRTTISLVKTDEVNTKDKALQALPADQVRLRFQDKINRSPEPREVVAKAACIEGNLGGVRVTRTEITDEGLRLKTKLRTADALTNIGNHYKEFGLQAKAELKYNEALDMCDEITVEARKLGGTLLEETYVQLWRIYFAMDKLKLAGAISQRLQREFPNSSFVDEAVFQQAEVARKSGNFGNAITLYQNLLKMESSALRGEGQYGIAECYEEMAKKEKREKAANLYERAFEEYKKVYSQFPESGRVGDSVAKMANFYYKKKDYARAVDVFENVLAEHPDANFLDVILFNYGRCLYRLDKKAEARRQFDDLINNFPDSDLAQEAKRIGDALRKSGF